MATFFGKAVMKLLPTRSLRRAVVASASDKMKWKLALPCEEKYWESYISQKATGQYGADFLQRIDPNFQLQPHIRQQIDAQTGASINILDVGAGPLSVLGKTWPGRTVRLTAVDPLANDYHRLLVRHNVAAPVPTRYCEAEKLAERFPENHFHLVYSRNALDHSYSPLTAIIHMVRLCRPNHVVMLQHLVNEGETEKYYGLHQWNFTQENNRFIIWNKHNKIDVAAELAARASVSSSIENNWLTVLIRKSAPKNGDAAGS